MKRYKYKHQRPLTAREEKAVLRLYVQERLPAQKTAERLRLDGYRVRRFLRNQDLLRPQGGSGGGGPSKLSPARRRELESEIPTSTNAVLARKYGLTSERIRQIRRKLGYPSSQVIRHEARLRAQAKRRERGQG
jgi:hypothetical protein